MCGIVGYTGTRTAAPVVLEGLKRLEYRGYDSAGLAVVNGGLEVFRAPGKIAILERELGSDLPEGTTAIAHTRWATHGAPTTANAHPHADCGGTLALVHNGIIENAGVLRQALTKRGHVFRSQTDTEVLSHLIEENHTKGMPLVDATAEALRQVEGTYGIAVISSREPDTIVAARRGSPLLVAIGNGENFVASDASAVLAHTRSVVYLDDGDIAEVKPTDYRIMDLDAGEKETPVTHVEWDLATIERGGYAHFMLKEIMEQPESVRNTLRGRLLEEEGTVRFGGLNISADELLKVQRIVITACGTSWHSALIGEYMMEELARIPTEVEYASEFRYRNPIVDERTLVIGISQKPSGAVPGRWAWSTWSAAPSRGKWTAASTCMPGPKSASRAPRRSRVRSSRWRCSPSGWAGCGPSRSCRAGKSCGPWPSFPISCSRCWPRRRRSKSSPIA